MSKLKIIVLFDRVLVDESEEQASTNDKSPVVRTLDKKEVEEEVAEALTKLGHDPTMHELDGTPRRRSGSARGTASATRTWSPPTSSACSRSPRR